MAQRGWRITDELRSWQEDAIGDWKRAERCGVIEAATGTGKTMVALAAMELLAAENGDRARVAVVVSSIEMAAQWRANLIDGLGVSADEIAEWHTAAPRSTSAPGKVVIAVINSARTRLPPLIRTWRTTGCTTLLVVDECHHAASPENRKIFEAPAHQRIGLSATIERQDREETVVYDGLGPVCYRYGLIDALNDGVVSPITSINLYVDLTEAERVRYAEHRAAIDRDLVLLSRELLESRNSVPNLDVNELRRLAAGANSRAAGLLKLIREQSALVKNASNRERCVAAIAPWLTTTTHSVLVFHESIPQAERSHVALIDAGLATRLEHSNLDSADRRRAVQDFRDGAARVLVVVKAADEGIDVPEASCALVVTCSGSKRQRVQRFGRVLRRQDDKHAVAISILVRGTPEEYVVGRRDEELLGADRVRHHCWDAHAAVGELLNRGASTYEPAQQGQRSRSSTTWSANSCGFSTPRPGGSARSPEATPPLTTRLKRLPLRSVEASGGFATTFAEAESSSQTTKRQESSELKLCACSTSAKQRSPRRKGTQRPSRSPGRLARAANLRPSTELR